MDQGAYRFYVRTLNNTPNLRLYGAWERARYMGLVLGRFAREADFQIQVFVDWLDAFLFVNE